MTQTITQADRTPADDDADAAEQFGRDFRAEQGRNYGCAGDIECTFKMDGNCVCFNTVLRAHRILGQQEAFAEALQIADDAANRGKGFAVGSGHETAENIRDAIRSAMEARHDPS